MKKAYTARELAEMKLPGFPHTRQGIEAVAKKQNWRGHVRNARGGGIEYRPDDLPAALWRAIRDHHIAQVQMPDMTPAVEIAQAIPETRSAQEESAKLWIVHHLESHCNQPDSKSISAMLPLYIVEYQKQAVINPGQFPYNVIASFSAPSFYRWRKLKEERPDILGGRYGHRKGQSVLNRANGGEVCRFIAALMCDNRHYKGGHLRDLVRGRFGKQLEVNGQKIELPSLRAFERHIAEWKEENAQLFTAITAPGQFKNRLRVVAGDASARIERMNQQWQIDASPADAICSDGRYSIYAIIDIWSRRALFSVSKTAKTDGSLLLVRKAIMEWGIPESIKTDNGADFVSKRFKLALLSLGIEQEISPPFSPEKKAFVERVIGTMQRDLMTILPGFAGHNVADRQRIRDQKDFAARMGETTNEAFNVDMTAAELQAALDSWAAGKYGRRVHESIGISPMEKAASWPEAVRKPKDIRALDLLLAPIAGGGGMRSVTKAGIRIDGFQYFSEGALPYIGHSVMVRHDPADLGRIYAFDDESRYLFEAINPESLGIDPMHFARKLQAAQAAIIAEKKKEINADRRKLDRKELAHSILAQHMESAIEAFPRPAEEYQTPALEEAARAVNTYQPPVDRIIVRQFATPQADSASDAPVRGTREWIERLQAIVDLKEQNQPVPVTEIIWANGNRPSAWFKMYFQSNSHLDPDELLALPADDTEQPETINQVGELDHESDFTPA